MRLPLSCHCHSRFALGHTPRFGSSSPLFPGTHRQLSVARHAAQQHDGATDGPPAAQGPAARECDRSARQQAQRERAAAKRRAKKEERDRIKSAVQKAGLDPKSFRSKLEELLLLLPDLTEAQMMSSLTADQLAELCADTAAVAERMVEFKAQAPKADLVSILRSWPAMLTKEHHGSLLLGHELDVTCVAVSADGRLAVTGSADSTLRVWSVNTCCCLAVLKGHKGSVQAVAVTPDGRRAASVSDDCMLRVWDLEEYACTATIPLKHVVCRGELAVSPDGEHALVAARDNAVWVWSVESQAHAASLEGHGRLVLCVAVSPDGRHALSGSFDTTLRVWDLRSKACTAVLRGHTGAVLSAAFTPDGRRAVSASWDETVRLWCTESGTCLAVLKGHANRVREVAVTPDGRHAVSSGLDRVLRVWDLDTHACVSTISLGPEDGVSSLAILPDGGVVVAGVTDKRVARILRLPGLS